MTTGDSGARREARGADRNSRLAPRASRLRFSDRLFLAIASLAIAGALVAAQIPKDTLLRAPLCWSQLLLGRACAGCGLTRSFAAIGRGDFAEASVLNPLGPVLFGWAVAVVAIRIGKMTLPSFRYWFEIDIAFAIAAGIALIARIVLFYLA